ncbi:MAG: RIP metalloprotease RseP [Clostridia bacterium]|nr:RIP metalloprotease RseP [Clostridia bacterium]
MYVLIGILLLGILIAVHEFGHFIAARISGIEVMEFAIGMGPRLCGWTGKTGTKFSLRAIPLGGFCAFYGEDDVEGKTKDDPRAYGKQNVWKRIFTVLMGPMMNFVLAIIVAVGVYVCMEQPIVEPMITEIVADSPAAQAGIQPGDVIIAVDGQSVLDGTTNGLLQALSNDGEQTYALTVRRGETTFDTSAATYWDEAENKYRIGIAFMGHQIDSYRMSFPQAVRAGWNYCLDAGTAVFDALKGLLTDPAIREQVAGPVGTVHVVSEAVRQDGLIAFFSLLVMISVNLGIMNLLPIPGLDGSRIVFHVIEAVRGKPIKPEREATIHLIGMLLLFALMIFFTFKDVMRLFN